MLEHHRGHVWRGGDLWRGNGDAHCDVWRNGVDCFVEELRHRSLIRWQWRLVRFRVEEGRRRWRRQRLLGCCLRACHHDRGCLLLKKGKSVRRWDATEVTQVIAWLIRCC